MDSAKHLAISVVLTLFIVGLGTVGYMIIEGWSFFDSAYMTIITITAVGYNEVHEISKVGRLFTVMLIFVGIGFCIYVAGAVVQFMVEGQIRTILGRKILDKKINKLKNHYIVCGYGRIGRVLCRKLRRKPVDLVVIENDKTMIPMMDKDKVLYVLGSAEDEMILLKAGIKQAKGLIAVLATDIDNVFLVLTARQLNSDIFIMARAGKNKSKSKLLAAGANQVESPYDTGALSMAQRVLRPTVANFLDLAFAYKHKNIQVEEMPVDASSNLTNIMLKDSGIRKNYNLIIIAIKKADGTMLFNPSFETTIQGGNTIIAMGEVDSLVKLERALNPI